jgi:peptidoglycan LD-endopeptidase CwlK
MTWDSSTVLVGALGAGYLALGWLGYRYLHPRRTSGRRLELVHPAPRQPVRDDDTLESVSRTQTPPPRGITRETRLSLPRALWHHRIAVLVFVFGLPIAMWGAHWLAINKLALDTPPEPTVDADIDWHLRGTRLVPPPPLPPEAFVTLDRPHLAGADRDWAKLQPAFRDKVLAAMKAAERRGYSFALLEGYRSPARQNFLAAQGAHITMATAFQSKHQFGLAADLSPVRDGVLIIRETDPWAMAAYVVLGEEARARGLTWGGDWAMRDYGHLEQR